MKDKGLYIIIAAVFFSPLALLFYIEWYWVFLIYNVFWAAASYAAHSETKNPKISARNAFLIPLVFNLIGFGYVAMKLNDDDDEIVEPKSNDELEAAKSRLRENILGTSKIEKVEKNISMDVGKILGMNPNSDCRVSFSFTEEWKSCYYQNKTGSEFNLNTLPLLKEDYIQDTGEPLLNDNNQEVYDPSQKIQHQKYLEVNQKEVYSSKTVIGLLQEKIKGKLDSGELHKDSKQDEILLALEVYDTCPESIILFFKSLGCDDYKNLERKNEYDNLLWTSSTQLEDEYVVFSLDEILNTKLKERKILSHEIMTKGAFMFENKKGEYLEVYGQRHTLFSETLAWDEENEEWDDVGEREEIDDFHLTDYEKGYQFSEDDLCKFFEIDDWPDWDSNGVSYDWCGIEEEDDNETRQKKWDDYKAKFPKATSIEHFDIENKKS